MYPKPNKIILMVIVSIVLPMLATAVMYAVFSTRITSDAYTIAETRVQRVAENIDQWLSWEARVVELAVTQFQERAEDLDDSDIYAILRSAMQASASLTNFYYGTEENRLYIASDWVPPAGWDLRSRPWYVKAASTTKTAITDPYDDAATGELVVTASKAVYSDNGSLLGVIGADIKISTIQGLLQDAPITQGSFALLYSGTKLVAGSNEVERQPQIDSVAQHLPLLGTGQVPLGQGLLKDRLVYAHMPTTGWHFAMYKTWADFFPYARSLWIYVVLVGLGIAGLAGGMSVLYYRVVAAPLLRLETKVNSLHLNEDGVDRIPLDIGTPDRLKALVGSFNKLLGRIHDYYMEINATKQSLERTNLLLAEAVVEERSSRQKLEVRQSHWRALFDNTAEAVVAVDKYGAVVAANEPFLQLFAWERAQVLGRDIDSLVASHRMSEAQALTQHMAIGVLAFQTTRLTSGGAEIEVEISIVPITVGDDLEGCYFIYRDVRARRQAERELQRLSEYDQLTGLYNRATFERKLKEFEQSGVLPMSVLLGDTNGLKIINDAFGHSLGDRMLEISAEAILSCVRPGDIVARVGGDEFALLLPNTTEANAVALATQIETKCRMLSEGLVQLSLTFGVSCKTLTSDNLHQLFAVAEDRMYRRKLREGKSVRGSMISSLMRALHEKTRDTSAHSNRMGEMARELAQKLGSAGGELDDIFLLATLHDIGKIGVPDHILNKPGSLSPEEWEVMRKHSEIGYRIAGATVELAHVAEGILHHHERYDGTGYPYGLKGEDIPRSARIIAVVDAYDAMTNFRTYRPALSHDAALDAIRQGSGTQFDPDVAAAFLDLMTGNQ